MANFGLKNAADLARFAEVSWSTASQWLAGSVPRKLALINLASRLHVTASWLETGEGVKEPVNLKEALAAKARVNVSEESCMREDPAPYRAGPDYLAEIVKLAHTADLPSLLDTMENLSKSAGVSSPAAAAVAQMIPIVRNRLKETPDT